MARGPSKTASPKQVETLTHTKAARKNIPTAEYQSAAERMEEQQPFAPAHYPRMTPLAEGETRERNADLDPQIIWRGARIRLSKEQARQLLEKGEVEIGEAQFVWRGKDRQDWSDLIVQAPPLYIQEKVHPKAIIDALKRQTKEAADAPDLFADFNGLPDVEARTEFYQHDQHWSNRFILGDSLSVMASLAEREGLRGKVQCIYFDPPYGIKFNSNWQVSTQSRDVKDGKQTDVSREPEQIKAFRDTWKDGVHSYLTYLRDRLTVARELLHGSGTLFVQISDENVHRVRAVMDEVFGPENYLALIAFQKTSGSTREFLGGSFDYIIAYSKQKDRTKFRPLYRTKEIGGAGTTGYNFIQSVTGQRRPLSVEERSGTEELIGRVLTRDNLTSQSIGRDKGEGAASWFPVNVDGQIFRPSEKGRWKTNETGMERLKKADRLIPAGNTLRYVRFLDDFPAFPISDLWVDTTVAGFAADKRYVVETSPKVIERCILMTTDPGDLVLDPTCGSGTTAYVAEQWGRRWITLDTSRVALALARTRLMSARYPYYLLADTLEGRRKEQEVSGRILPDAATHGDIRLGFVYERAPHVTLKSIANNAEIDIIYDKWQAKLEPLRAALNKALGRSAPSSFETRPSAAPHAGDLCTNRMA